jgi:hypothetical protein
MVNDWLDWGMEMGGRSHSCFYFLFAGWSVHLVVVSRIAYCTAFTSKTQGGVVTVTSICHILFISLQSTSALYTFLHPPKKHINRHDRQLLALD